VHFVQLVPWGAEVFSDRGVLSDSAASPIIHLFPNVLALWDSPAFVTALLVSAAALCVLFAIGFGDRIGAVAIWYIWACLFGRNPLIANPSLPFVGWMLLAHAFLPRSPYGSWSARGRPDPGNGWSMPPMFFAAAWIVMAVGYSYSGYTKLISPSWVDGTAMERVLSNPLARPGILRDALLGLASGVLHVATWGALALELFFAPLALFRRLRPWLWCSMLVMHLSLMLLIDFADLSLGMIMLHLFTFDPAWVRPVHGDEPAVVFYDGHCGLCHRFVRFALAEDRTGEIFRFAPLGGEAFLKSVPDGQRANLPDSIVLRATDRGLLTRSAAVMHIFRSLGGVWRVIAWVLALIPATLRDGLYDGVAGIRYRLFARPAEACPIVPPHLRARFDA
jgi:predicted DCC family thiol-disulfide oxidoreductase YuxK